MSQDADLKEALLELDQIERVQKDRKKNAGIDYYTPNAAQLRCHQSKAKIILFVGGNRCLGKETKVYDPVLGKEREVGSIDSDFHVLAFDGKGLRITKALRPFRKTKDRIYKINLSNGGEFTASLSHVVLTPSGFRTISDVQPGDELYLPQTILEPFQSTHGEDGLSSYRKAEGSLSDYRSLLRLCGGLLQRGEGIDPGVSPSQDGVQGHISFSDSSHTDGLNNKLTYTQSCQSTLRLSTQDVQTQTWGLHDGSVSDVFYTTSKCADLNIQIQQQSVYEYSSPKLNPEVSQYSKPSYSFDKPSCVVVTSIAYVRNDYKWDFTVPVYHNYFASGAIHHNSGKSTVGAAELALHLTRKYPDWFPKERRFHRPIKAVVVCDANAKIEKVIEPKIREYLPKKYIIQFKRIGSYLNRIVCADGSTVDFLSAEQDDMAFEGADWDFYWGDEPQKKRKFDAVMRGLIDRGGRTLLTFTPLVEPWMKELLVDKADGKRIETFVVDTTDNLYDIKGNPILTQENIDEMMSMWDEETIETRIHGKFFHLRGVVYPGFCDVHQTRFDYTYPDPVICVMDPHDRQPHHVIWAVIDRTDDIHVHSEMSIHCTVKELSAHIRKLEKDQGYNVRRRIIDPNFGRKPLITTGRNMIEELCKEGCSGWMEADDAKDEGHLKVKEYLFFQRNKAISEVNKPKLFFHKERVPKTIHSIKNYQYEEWVGKIAGERDPKEMPKQKETHGADVIRYLCMTNPRYEFLRYRNDYELEAPVY